MPILDFNKEFKNNQNLIITIDENYNAYKPRAESDGVVFVEKCLCRKERFLLTTLGEKKRNKAMHIKGNAIKTFPYCCYTFKLFSKNMTAAPIAMAFFLKYPSLWIVTRLSSYCSPLSLMA